MSYSESEIVDTTVVPTQTSYKVKPTQMQRVAEAMRVLHILVNCNGRRFQSLELASKMQWITWDETSPMLTVPMATRAERRKLQGKQFRPVYGYVGPKDSPFDVNARRTVDEPNLVAPAEPEQTSTIPQERQEYERHMAEQLVGWRNA